MPKYYNIIIEKSYNSTAIKKKFKIGDYILVTGIFDIFDSKLFHVDDINDKIKIHMKRCYNIEKINKLKTGIIMNNNNNRKVTDGEESRHVDFTPQSASPKEHHPFPPATSKTPLPAFK